MASTSTASTSTQTRGRNPTEGNDSEIEFDYDVFYEMFKESFKTKSTISCKGYLKTTDEVNHTIRNIIDNSKKKAEYFYYDIINENDTAILVLKRNSDTSPIIEVIAEDSYFACMVEIFFSKDQWDDQSFINKVKQRYHIPLEAINVFIDIIGLYDKTFRENTKGASLAICEWKNDNSFRYILIYIDLMTEYILLRPLVTKGCDETAYELSKIFSSFGLPLSISTTSFAVRELEVALKNVQEKVPTVTSRKVRTDIVEEVSLELSDWISKTGCDSWAFGLNIIQWKMNTRQTGPARIETPYLSVFGVEPNHDLIILDPNSTENESVNNPVLPGAEPITPLCTVCTKYMYKHNRCDNCLNTVHFYCSMLNTINTNNVISLKTTCLKCTNAQPMFILIDPLPVGPFIIVDPLTGPMPPK